MRTVLNSILIGSRSRVHGSGGVQNGTSDSEQASERGTAFSPDSSTAGASPGAQRRWPRSRPARGDPCCRKSADLARRESRRTSRPGGRTGLPAARIRNSACVAKLFECPRRSMLVTRLPKRSTISTVRQRGWSPWPQEAGYRAVESRSPPGRGRLTAMPLASHAAAGAKRSRPSNVRLTVGRHTDAPSARRDGAAAFPGGPRSARRCRARRSDTRRPRRRCPPRGADAGIDDGQEHGPGRECVAGRELQRALEDVMGGHVVVMSTSVASGQMPRITPFIVPA